MDQDGPIYFDRRPAASGALSYADRITIRDTSQVSIEAVPYFIPHRSSEDELSMKLIRVDKRSGEKCEITLNDSDLRQLKLCIAQALAVAGQEDDGQYLVLRADDLAHTVESSDDAVRAVGGALDSHRFARRVAQHVNPEALASAFSAVVRIGELRAAITELRENLDNGVTLEDVYQKWCDKHSWAFGNAYVARDNWRTIGIGDQVDLLMKSTASGFRDIFELKRPDMDVLSFDSTHRNWYWSSQTSKAIGQCHRYLDTFHRAAEHGIQPDHTEIIAYHPRAVVVIGRSNAWDQSKVKALHGLNSRMHGITVMTYDQLLARCSVLLGQVHSEQASEAEEYSDGLSA
ncbi:Shedu anti-phage system protein SduA domain-containing protein [Streptomyces sp. NPDC091879]|uniref:Shedu anti-phage system protein SduA domain-containing protein n=1 Tax=Streptomyces sp. NPDC091879 TaxID=3366006 RepID=UPI00382E0354